MTRAPETLSLAYSILAGPIVWAVHFIIVYMFTEFGCRSNFENWLFVSPANIYAMIVVATVVCLLVVGFGGLLAFRRWRTQEGWDEADSTTKRYNFLVMMGILMSALFLYAIVMTAAPAIFLSACEQAI